MKILQREDVAQLGLQPDQAEFLALEFNRAGRVILPSIEDGIVTGVSRYTSGYFRTLMEENRLPPMSEDQLVIGLE